VVSRKSRSSPSTARPQHAATVLVLQGGGALGAYQAGVYEGMHEAGMEPDWVTGVSIGAINGAIIAGNRPENRVARLMEFWERVSSGFALDVPAPFDLLRLEFNRWSASASAMFGVPGFFQPRFPSPLLTPSGSPGALSVYDSTPLHRTLQELVEFDLINERKTRFAVGAVELRAGNSIYFDNQDPELVFGPQHVMASGALPPGLPPIHIKEGIYWDGGLVSNSPLWYVLDDGARLDALIFQVDLFSARGPAPRNLDEVLERAKDIQYSSKTRFNTSRAKEEEALRQALTNVIDRLPARLRKDPDVALLAERARRRRISIVHLINRRSAYSSQSKDYEFSRTTVRALWAAGLADMRKTMSNPRWRKACSAVHGMRTYDLLPRI
jgi:NTE family protein